MEKYRVIGKFEGRKIREVVTASNKRHAKLRGGFSAGFGGNSLSSFMKSSSIKVKRMR